MCVCVRFHVRVGSNSVHANVFFVVCSCLRTKRKRRSLGFGGKRRAGDPQSGNVDTTVRGRLDADDLERPLFWWCSAVLLFVVRLMTTTGYWFLVVCHTHTHVRSHTHDGFFPSVAAAAAVLEAATMMDERR